MLAIGLARKVAEAGHRTYFTNAADQRYRSVHNPCDKVAARPFADAAFDAATIAPWLGHEDVRTSSRATCPC